MHYVHAVWTTKRLKPNITLEIIPSLKQFFIDQARNNCIQLIEVGIWINHVHILLKVENREAKSAAIMRLKGASSRWLNATYAFEPPFRWQHRYWDTIVRPGAVPSIRKYISNQIEHHLGGSDPNISVK
jgi:putative transposase